MSPVRGVVLDLWNTLAHHPDGDNPLLRLGEALGIADRPGWARTLARATMTRPFPDLEATFPDLEAAFGLTADPERRGRALRAWEGADTSARLFPDVVPTLDALRSRGYGLALLSNTQSFDLSVLERDGLRARFDAVRLSCDTGWLKPDPPAFGDAAGALGLPPEQLVMVGDSLEDDVHGARAAGLRAFLLRRAAPGLSHHETGGDDAIPDLTTLVERLA